MGARLLGFGMQILHAQSNAHKLLKTVDILVHTYDFLKIVGGLWALKWAWQFNQSIGIDEKSHVRLSG